MNGLYLPSGYNNVNFSTPRSFASFGLLMLNRGIWANDTLMEDQDYFDAMVNTSQDLNKSYGYLTWLNGKESYQLPGITVNIPGYTLPDAPADLFAALGKDGQYNLIIPSQNMVVIRMGEDADGITGLVPTIMANEIMRRIGSMDCNISSTVLLKSWKPEVIIQQHQIEVLNGSLKGLELYDLQGRRIQDSSNNTIQTSGIQSGIYILTMRSNNGTKHQKVFLQ
jgi:hypothetical protein